MGLQLRQVLPFCPTLFNSFPFRATCRHLSLSSRDSLSSHQSNFTPCSRLTFSSFVLSIPDRHPYRHIITNFPARPRLVVSHIRHSRLSRRRHPHPHHRPRSPLHRPPPPRAAQALLGALAQTPPLARDLPRRRRNGPALPEPALRLARSRRPLRDPQPPPRQQHRQ